MRNQEANVHLHTAHTNFPEGESHHQAHQGLHNFVRTVYEASRAASGNREKRTIEWQGTTRHVTYIREIEGGKLVRSYTTYESDAGVSHRRATVFSILLSDDQASLEATFEPKAQSRVRLTVANIYNGIVTARDTLTSTSEGVKVFTSDIDAQAAEGRHKTNTANQGVEFAKEYCEALIDLSANANDRLLETPAQIYPNAAQVGAQALVRVN